MAARVLNIEVGDCITKVCGALPGKKSSRVAESFMFRTPAGLVSDGAISEPEALADKLRLELESHGLGGVKTVVFSVASGKIASREIKLPYMKDKALAQAVQTNASDYFPVDISRYHVTYMLLERVKGAEGFTRVLVLAAPLALLEGYFKLAEFAKLDIKTIDSCSNSHYQLVKKLDIPMVSMFVEVDCSASFVSFLAGKELLLQRTFAFGGGELISGYLSDTSRTEEDYIKALGELCDNSPDFVGEDGADEATVEEGLDRLVYNIVRSVEYFNSFRWEAATAQIVLTGPCGHLVGIKKRVAEATELPCVYLEELPGAGELCPGADISAYISCIGSNIAPVNFMPDYLLRRRRLGRKNENREETLLKGTIACGVLVLAAVAITGISIYNCTSASRQLETVRAEIASLEPAEQTYLTYNSYLRGEEALLSVRSLSRSPNSELVAFFEELEEKMPSQILILSAVCTPEGVSMSITVPGLEEAAVVLSQLRSFDSLGSVEVSGIVSQGEDGGNTCSFTLDCTYGLNPYMNNINPYGDVFSNEPAEGGESAEVPAEETEAAQ